MTGGRGRDRQWAQATRRAQLADFLPRLRRDGSHLTPEAVADAREALSRIWGLLEGGGVIRVVSQESAAAPTGHPDAPPFGSGVRTDGRATLAVIIEFAPEGQGQPSGDAPSVPDAPPEASAQERAFPPAQMPPAPSLPPHRRAALVSSQLDSAAEYEAFRAGALCGCGGAKEPGSHGCDLCGQDIPF